MEDLKKLNTELKNYLEKISTQLTEDLIHLLKGEKHPLSWQQRKI